MNMKFLYIYSYIIMIIMTEYVIVRTLPSHNDKLEAIGIL